MTDIVQLMEQLNVGDLRERMYRAPTPSESDGMGYCWLVGHSVAEALEREPHTIGKWLSPLVEDCPPVLMEVCAKSAWGGGD